MAKLYFHYSTMNAGKSTLLLQAAHNYAERGMQTYLLTTGHQKGGESGGAGTESSSGSDTQITSRIGISKPADIYLPDSDLFEMIKAKREAAIAANAPIACVLIDEAQFLTPAQVWQLARVVDDQHCPVMCYGLRVDFMGKAFPGSAALLALADEMRECRTVCHCGKKATMVVRKDKSGRIVKDGEQIQIGGNETYVSLCRRHWRLAVSD